MALAYAKEGAHLILVGRTTGALEEVDDEIREQGGNATLLTLDLKNHDKIDALGPTIYQRWQKLDILVGNAGILGPLSPLGHVTADAWDEVLEVNLTANWHLIRTLDPLLRRSDAGRAIFVSSGAAVSRPGLLGPLHRRQGRARGPRCHLCTRGREHARPRQPVNPGPTRTKMRAKAFPGENPAPSRGPRPSHRRSCAWPSPPAPTTAACSTSRPATCVSSARGPDRHRHPGISRSEISGTQGGAAWP